MTARKDYEEIGFRRLQRELFARWSEAWGTRYIYRAVGGHCWLNR